MSYPLVRFEVPLPPPFWFLLHIISPSPWCSGTPPPICWVVVLLEAGVHILLTKCRRGSSHNITHSHKSKDTEAFTHSHPDRYFGNMSKKDFHTAMDLGRLFNPSFYWTLKSRNWNISTGIIKVWWKSKYFRKEVFLTPISEDCWNNSIGLPWWAWKAWHLAGTSHLPSSHLGGKVRLWLPALSSCLITSNCQIKTTDGWAAAGIHFYCWGATFFLKAKCNCVPHLYTSFCHKFTTWVIPN